MKYDYLIVGAGLFGAIFAREMAKAGKSVLIIEKRKHIAGNIYTDDQNTHFYGPHLFHTNNDTVWAYVNQFTKFNNYQHRSKANFNGKIYSLPFNMNTFNQLWGCIVPQEAKDIIDRQKLKIENPSNLEEQALASVGPEIYHTLIYGYTKKQWHREPRDLPASIIKRIPVRFTYNDNYFDDKHQGIPINGYTQMVANIIDGIEVKTSEDFFDLTDWRIIAKKLVYTGPIDKFFNYQFGELEYRSLRFKHTEADVENFQGIGIMNYTSADVPYTRIVEHKHFYDSNLKGKSKITYEFPSDWDVGKEPYYPINDEKNNSLFQKYKNKLMENPDIIGGGRLCDYKYMDMDGVIASALKKSSAEIGSHTHQKFP